MAWMNEPLSQKQIAAILNQFNRVGLPEHLRESGGPADLSAVQELIERLMRAADPASGQVITQGDLTQAMNKIRTDLRAQLGRR